MFNSTATTRRRALLAGPALAAAIAPLTMSCAAPLARVDVYDRTEGQTLETYRHRGRKYIVGQPGNQYAIRIRNTTGGRVLAVVSVDGVNVVTGETASPDQAGYVIEPGGYVNVQGWRKDLNRTAAFYFSDPGDAYATEAKRLELARHEWKRMSESDSRECRKCHGFGAMKTETRKPRAKKSHETAVKDKMTCINCHKGIAHQKPKGMTDQDEDM